MATSWTPPHTYATGDVLTSANMNEDRDNLSWLGTDKPSCRVYNSAAISIPNNALTYLTFDTERFDNQNIHSTVTNTGRFTIPTGMAGKYLIGGHGVFNAGVGTSGGAAIRLNGVTVIAKAAANAFNWVLITTLYQLAAGDYVELGVIQTSGGAINLNNEANDSPEFWAIWLST